MDGSHKALSSGETTPPGGGGGGGSGSGSGNIQTLDPNAKEWSFKTNGAPKEDRCLYITFSNGHPIADHRIRRFFTLKYGDCLERVYVYRPGPNDVKETNITTPQFGKTSSVVVGVICTVDINTNNRSSENVMKLDPPRVKLRAELDAESRGAAAEDLATCRTRGLTGSEGPRHLQGTRSSWAWETSPPVGRKV
ncbi:hypothetical protein V6N13_004532 [Hibiscus sabdariffa]